MAYVLFLGSQKPADSGHHDVKPTDSEDNINVSGSSLQNSYNHLSTSCNSGTFKTSTGVHLSRTGGSIMTAREFAQSIECWLWQQQCWAQQVSWSSWMYYSMPLYAAIASTTTSTPGLPFAANDARQSSAPLFHQTVNQQQPQQAGSSFINSLLDLRKKPNVYCIV